MRRLLCLLLLLAATADAQRLPPAPFAQAGKSGLAKAALASAKRALASGRPDDAARYFGEALADDPWNREALSGLVKLSEKTPARQALWRIRLAAAIADAKGKLRLSKQLEALLPKSDPHPARIAVARAQAAQELARFLKKARKRIAKDGGAALLQGWGEALTWELVRTSPALTKAHAKSARSMLELPPFPWDPVIAALSDLVLNQGGTAPEAALRAARCLRGLSSQAGFKDLKGPEPPDLAAERTVADRGIARARAAIGRDVTALTVEQLEEMTPPEREEFTRTHADPARPGVAVSPNGLYRIETICGHDTLLGAARTVELHHGRLARWFGKDPFQRRQGTVRIVPEASGLESEGTPYWWAGGFQSGDVTTVKFAVSSIEGLGRTLTHELTHRFDGTLFTLLPSWLVEGRAVWTGAAYAASTDETFVENHVRFGTIENALIKGYGNEDNLEKLITGTIDDYRDNYVAGYALFVFLATWEKEGKPLFTQRLERFMKGGLKGRSNPKKWFVHNFADGKAGRPEDLKAFAKEFHGFLQGFHWLSRADWTERYTRRTGRGAPHRWVYDAPTWTLSRARAEPWFGQDQARMAGDIFHDVGDRAAAARAYLWSLEVDEWRPRVAARLAEHLEATRRPRLAWLARYDSARRLGEIPEVEAPFAPELPKLAALLRKLEEAAASYRGEGRIAAAAALEADRDRLAVFLGGKSPARKPLSEETMPHEAPAELAALHGWTEDELTGYDEHRVPELWYVTDDGDLHVGRKKPRKGTGTMDRHAHKRHSYVRTDGWQPPGRYRLKTRVIFTTSYVTGAVIIGDERRDRNVRFAFNAGDYMYAIGQSEKPPELASFGWRLDGLRSRDGGLPGASTRGAYEFDYPRPSFALELIVDGPEVLAFVEGDWVGSYHTVDGAPVEGFIGFATSWGAVQIQRPVIERLDRGLAAGRPLAPGRLDLDVAGDEPIAQLRNRRCRGIPLGPEGTTVVWLPQEKPEEGATADDVADSVAGLARQVLRHVEKTLRDDRIETELVLAVPADLPKEAITRLRARVPSVRAGNVPVLRHHRTKYLFPLDRPNMPAEPMPAILFVDPAGALRAAEILHPAARRLPWSVWHWSIVFREGAER